ncbi:MAG: hypothetical protein IKZ63_01350 [Oscillospiraceae bacterium]|nr:hypothetical protein [Oscillospiraceae bacterium]
MSKITSSKNILDDGTTLYDEYGNVIGTQYKNVLDDGVSTYDKYGNKIATSYQNTLDDGVSTYDRYGNKIASTYGHVMDDGSSTYDRYGNKIADTYQNVLDPYSSTTNIYGDPTGIYGAGVAGNYGGGYTPYVPSGGYYGYSAPKLSPREIKKNRICSAFWITGIVGMALSLIYGIIGLIKPDLVRFDLDIFAAVYAASLALISVFTAFEMGEMDWESVGTLFLVSLLYFYICGQATYNANGFSQASAGMAWNAVKHIAFIAMICLFGGKIIGLILEKAFSGSYKNGNLGLAADVLSFCAAAGTCFLVFTGRELLHITVLTAVFAALIFLSVFSVVHKRGTKGLFNAVIRTLIMTGAFTALIHEYRYRMGIGSLISMLTSMISLRWYIIFGCSAAAGMILGAVLKKIKNKQN